MTLLRVMAGARTVYSVFAGPPMGIERRSPERLAADELSESDLEHVAGGLARVWAREEVLDVPIVDSSVTP